MYNKPSERININNPDPNSDLYISEGERFNKDFAAYDYNRRNIEHEKKKEWYQNKKTQLYDRERKRWERMDYEYLREENKIMMNKERNLVGRKNNPGMAFNPITLQYDNSVQGEILKRRDDESKFRALMRATNIDKHANAGYNILNGQERTIMENRMMKEIEPSVYKKNIDKINEINAKQNNNNNFYTRGPINTPFNNEQNNANIQGDNMNMNENIPPLRDIRSPNNYMEQQQKFNSDINMNNMQNQREIQNTKDIQMPNSNYMEQPQPSYENNAPNNMMDNCQCNSQNNMPNNNDFNQIPPAKFRQMQLPTENYPNNYPSNNNDFNQIPPGNIQNNNIPNNNEFNQIPPENYRQMSYNNMPSPNNENYNVPLPNFDNNQRISPGNFGNIPQNNCNYNQNQQYDNMIPYNRNYQPNCNDYQQYVSNDPRDNFANDFQRQQSNFDDYNNNCRRPVTTNKIVGNNSGQYSNDYCQNNGKLRNEENLNNKDPYARPDYYKNNRPRSIC